MARIERAKVDLSPRVPDADKYKELDMRFPHLDTVCQRFVGWVPSHARKPRRRFRRRNEASIKVQEDRPTERPAEQKIE